MDLVFPHHECEIAQAVASQGDQMVHYWMHNNMITIEGKKMGKSYNNFITLNQFFDGAHEKLQQPYSPMTIRFFILMAHYRGTVDFSNEALQAAEKALARLMEAYTAIDRIKPAGASDTDVKAFRSSCYEAMDDDLNTPIVISILFDAAKVINQAVDGKANLVQADVDELRGLFDTFLFGILGMRKEQDGGNGREEAFSKVVDMLLEQRSIAKANKDWATSDKIRNELTALGFEIKDTKDGATWKLNK